MRWSILTIAAVLAISQLAVAERGQFSAQGLNQAYAAVAQGLQEIPRDNDFWATYLKEARKELQDLFATNSNDNTKLRHLLSSDSQVDASTLDLALKGWELILNAGGTVRNVLDAGRLRVQEFFSNMLGPNWNLFVPSTWLNGNFNWDALSMFEYNSNLHDLMTDEQLNLFQAPASYGELYWKLNEIADKFCDFEEFKPTDKVPTRCQGPSVHLSYVPKQCIIESRDRQIICDPAKLVLTKVPGSCTLKHFSAFQWVGKQCRFVAEIGQPLLKVIGGDPYDVDLTDLVHDRAADLFTNLKPTAPVSVVLAPVLNQPTQLKVTWTPPEKYALQAILKYQVTCISTIDPNDTRTLKVLSTKREAIIGAATTGDNRALAPTPYTCHVAAINAMGTGPTTTGVWT